MAKHVIEINADKLSNLTNHLEELSNKEFEIKNASLSDSLCNYGYELLTGKTKGDIIPTRKGKHIIHEDLEEAFKRFNVFFAHLDDVYTGNDNATELSTLESEPETDLYFVSSFKITGVEENKSLIISGTKSVKHGIISFDSPKVKLNGNYLYLTQLLECLSSAITEVEAYMNGKSAPQDDPNQTHMDFASEDAAFETARIEE